MDKTLTLFLDALKRPATRKEYQRQLESFIDYHKIMDFGRLLAFTDEKLEEMIQTYMSYLKNTKKLKYSSCNIAKSALRAFFSINKKKIDWFIIGRYLPERQKPEGNKPYTNEDINAMLANTAILRDKAIIHFLASTGCRVGAILDPPLKMKHLYDMPEGCKAVRLYDGSREEYLAFLTPEASKALGDYLHERERNGEMLSKESSLFRLGQFPAKDFPITMDSIRSSLRPLAMLLDRIKDGQRYEKQLLLAFRHRFIEICVRKRLDYRLAEKMVSHSSQITPMDKFYTNIDSMRDALFEEFRKIMPELTIDNSERLKIKNQKLEDDKNNLTIRREEFDARNKAFEELKTQFEQEHEFLVAVNQTYQDIKDFLKNPDTVKTTNLEDVTCIRPDNDLALLESVDRSYEKQLLSGIASSKSTKLHP
ncbi:MAG: tyrosine-type recombinase/integrase [Nitrosotalea sp.]